MAHDVFISYSRLNESTAFAICAKLEEKKIRCFIDQRDIPYSADYRKEITRGLRDTKYVVFVFSRASSKSRHVTLEIQTAFDFGKTVFPFKIEPATISDSLNGPLSGNDVHWIDAMTPPLEDKIDQLALVISRSLEGKVTLTKKKKLSLDSFRHVPNVVKYGAGVVALLGASFGIFQLRNANFSDSEVREDDYSWSAPQGWHLGPDTLHASSHDGRWGHTMATSAVSDRSQGRICTRIRKIEVTFEYYIYGLRRWYAPTHISSAKVHQRMTAAGKRYEVIRCQGRGVTASIDYEDYVVELICTDNVDDATIDQVVHTIQINGNPSPPL